MHLSKINWGNSFNLPDADTESSLYTRGEIELDFHTQLSVFVEHFLFNSTLFLLSLPLKIWIKTIVTNSCTSIAKQINFDLKAFISAIHSRGSWGGGEGVKPVKPPAWPLLRSRRKV